MKIFVVDDDAVDDDDVDDDDDDCDDMDDGVVVLVLNYMYLFCSEL